MSRWAPSIYLWLSLLQIAACTDAKKPPPTPRAPKFQWPTTFSRSVHDSEEVSFALGKLSREVCSALQGPPNDALPKLDRLLSSTAAPSARAWIQALASQAKTMSAVERCGLKADQVLLAQGAAWARYDFWLQGPSQGASRHVRGQVRAKLSGENPTWRFDQVESAPLKTVDYKGPRFVDVSQYTGVGLHRTEEKTRAMFTDLGNINLVNIGGVSVFDWNQDGAQDILVYNIGSLFTVFLNDGRSGFVRMDPERLIPPAQAAIFYLPVDLDNDGRQELIGTEPLSCRGADNRIPIYALSADGMRDTQRGVRLDADCEGRFSHVSAEDFDADGDLDLFFSDYGLHKSTVQHNLVDAVDGGRNRLFRNDGKLRFTEVSEAAGIDRQTRRSFLSHWFDYTGDGRRDLLVINDFASNKLYENLGGGKLKKRDLPPLTEAGFSMGISTADFDNDEDFDVYISNMYSYAGLRILAVTPDAGDKRATLLKMAQGNVLYQNQGPGQYRQVSQSMGVDRALWAWGHAFFDADNDGDLDLHVVNGLASNPDPRAKDAPDN